MKKFLIILVSVLFIGFICYSPSKSLAATTSKRLAGNNRFDVAINVSKEGWQNGSGTVILANYLAFADALAATPLAYKEKAPILLTEADRIDDNTINEIIRLKATKVLLVGGTGSISDQVITQLQGIGITQVDRIGGTDRFDVATNVAKQLNPTNTAIIANGLNFPDALSIAPYAAENGYPILLTDNLSPDALKQTLASLNITKTVVVGGEGSVSKGIADSLPSPLRIGGADRYEVSANVVQQLNLSTTKAFIATGSSFADALTGSVLAANENAPMLLTSSQSVPSSIYNLATSKKIQDFVILGGTSSVSDNTFQIISGQIPLVPPTPVLPLSGKVIVVDPGHGGNDSGAVKNGLYEKTLNLQFATKLGADLQKLGAKVIFTRPTNKDVYVSLAGRTAIANNANADLFISIHHDSNTSTSPRGFSLHYSTYRPAIETKDVYVLSNGVKYPFVREDTANKDFIVKNGSSTKALSYEGNNIAYDPTPSIAAVKSLKLAQLLVKSLVYSSIVPTTTYSSSGIRDSNLYVTRWTKMPSILVELGFISNSTEAKLLANSSVQTIRAQALANSVKQYFSTN